MIEFKQLNKRYQNSSDQVIHALKNINLSIEPGEIFGIIGKSGAGKSTLLRCINMLEQPSSGQVLIANQEITSYNSNQLRQARRQMGMIFQHFNLLHRKTVAQNIALPLEISGVTKQQIDERVVELCELVGLPNKLNSLPSALSGGQKQRVAIARALACQPKILLCDEATSALDPESTNAILKLLQTINSKLGITIVLITHEMSVIKSICDRVAVIDDGEIIEVNTPMELLLNPTSTVAKEFLKTAIQQTLPTELVNRLQNQPSVNTIPLAHLAFVGDSVQAPLISKLASKLDIHISILQADIEYIKNISVGHMVVELPQDPQKVAQAREFLQSQNVLCEVIGYV